MKSSIIDQDSDSGDDEQSNETVDAGISEEDADVIKGNRVTCHNSGEAVLVLESKTRNRPSFLSENVQVCVEMDVNRLKEKGSQSWRGRSSATSYSSDTPSSRTRVQEYWVTSLQYLMHRGDELRGDHSRITDTVSVPLQSPAFVGRTPRRSR